MNKLPEWANWVARDKDGDLWVYDNKPEKVREDWFDFIGGNYEWINDSEGTFSHAKWEDEEPTRIVEKGGDFKKTTLDATGRLVIGSDMINKPNHYIGTQGLEVREVQRNFASKFSKYGGLAEVDAANLIKYVLRAPEKNGVEDLKKACKMIEWIVEQAEKES